MTAATGMEPPRALCITSNASLRRTLQRTLKGAGSSVEFTDRLTEEHAHGAAIIVMDQDYRRQVDPEVIELVGGGGGAGQAGGGGRGGKIIMVGDSLEDDEVVTLIRDLPMNHLISDLQNPDELELLVTSVKLLSGDIFGLQKYLAWGVAIRESSIATYDEKRDALIAVSEHAMEVGARRQVVAKIESVADELLMNALYDAPAIRQGVSRKTRIHKSNINEMPSREAALLRYACDGRYFALSVEDSYGELHKETILDHLSRARAERGRPRPSENGSGAGLGLYFILSSVTRFIANVEPGTRTEVICLFDMRQRGREAKNCARSLHIFLT
ncbi:MAG: hypothetical protein MJE77_41165 [Proteobacteria bacterium]|nr:hypothetical protein [Pseudomonadota bacterium]